MFDDFFDKIGLAIREFLAKSIIKNMNDLVLDLNTKVGEISADVAKGPDTWNGAVFDFIKSLSENVFLPVAALIITYVFVYELYNMAVEQNRMKEFGPADFFRFLMKNCITVLILVNTFKIVMAIFDIGGYIVEQATGQITDSILINLGDYDSMLSTLVEYEIPELVAMLIESGIIRWMIMILSIIITVVLYGRMIEIYLYISVAPVPFAAFGNRELSSVSQNYVKGLIALAFQGFFILLCVSIYAKLVQGITGGTDIHGTLFNVAACSLVLMFMLLKSGQISKSIFGAH